MLSTKIIAALSFPAASFFSIAVPVSAPGTSGEGSAFFFRGLSFPLSWTSNRFSRRAFRQTVTLERAIAAALHMGFMEIMGYTPAATGISRILYAKAQNKFSRIFFSVFLLNRMAAETSVSLEFIRTISAESTATSVPAPMAIPISAPVSAGASLIPSPTMAVLPRFCRFLITAAFPSGKTPAMTRSTPASFPMASAVR